MISPRLIWITFGIYIIFLVTVAIIENRMDKANSTHGFATGGGKIRWPVLRVILAVIFLTSSLPYVASVLIAISTAANLVTGGRIPYQYVVIIIGITIAVYTMVGWLGSLRRTVWLSFQLYNRMDGNASSCICPFRLCGF